MVHLFKPTSYRAGAAWAVSSTLVWKIVSFANALLIAAYFGAGNTTDVYFYLIMVMGFAVTFLQRMNTLALIPEAQTREEKQAGSGKKLLNSFLYLYGGLFLLLSAVGLFYPVSTGEVFSRFPTERLLAEKTLLRAGFILCGLQLITNYLTAILEMHRRFATAILSPLNALLPLLFLVFGGKSWGINSMIYGFLSANLLQIIIFLHIMKKELAWDFTLSETSFSRPFLRNLVSNQLIACADIVASLLPLYLLSGFSAGLVSALNYARQLSDSPTEIFTYRVANISKIQLTEYAAKKEWVFLNRSFLSTQHFLLFLLTPLAVFTIFYAPEIISLFFKRGEFSGQDTAFAAAFLRPLMGLMWFLVLISMQGNIVAAGRKIKESLPYSLTGIFLFLISVPVTMLLWGAFAYPYTQLGCCIASLLINYYLFKRYFPQVAYGAFLKQAGRVLSLNILAIFPSAVYAFFLAGDAVFVTLLIGGIIFLTALFMLTKYSGDWEFFRQQLHKEKI